MSPVFQPISPHFEVKLGFQSPESQTVQRSILSLDNSNEPFETQILDICGILDIQIDVENHPSSLDQEKQQETNPYGLREEWALKWLLKKFRSDDIHLGSPCLEFRAWLLFRALAIRIPLANTARLLNTYKFMVIFTNTIIWLQQKVDQGRGFSPEEHEDASVTAESSSATLEAAPIEAPRWSKKRKREVTSVSPSERVPPVDPNIEALYKSICSIIREMEALTRDLPDGSRGFSVEYMKASLRSSPQDAAAILGSSFTITDELIRRSDEPSAEILDECISPMLALWNLRTDTKDDLAGHSDFRAISTHSLLPLLQLLLTSQTLSPSRSKTGKTTESLEMLLVKYIIFPARASFLSLKQSRAGRDEENESSLYNDLLAPLSKITSSCEAPDVSPAAVYYSVAIKCIPRKTPKQRTAENPWLQSLFRQLIGSAFATPPLPPNSIGPLMRTIKSMLQEALNHEVLLDISTLETLLSRSSGLISESNGPNIVDWDFVSLLLKLNPDVFIRLSPQRASNNFLTSLLTNITRAKFEASIDHSNEYGKMISGVILPLVQAFVHARDLPRFIDHWGKELTRHHGPLEDQDAGTSIWEDDHLSRTVADLIKSALTTGQLRQVLLAAHADLTLFVSNKIQNPLVSLVILDCALSGCTSDVSVVELMDPAQTIYISLLNIVSDDRLINMLKMWRVWRTLATINIRWSIPHTAPRLKSAEDHVIRRALKLVDHDVSKSNFAEELYAFNYILSFAALEKSGSEKLQNPPCQTIGRAVETILNHQEILSDLLISENWVVSRPSCSAPQWNGRSNGIESTKTLIMACQAQVLFSPEALRCLDYETNHRYFQQLFNGAVWQSMSNEQHCGPTTSDHLNYLKLWQRLLRSNLLYENALAAGCYRKLLISEYSNSRNAMESDKLFSKMRHQLALESLQCIPVHAFDREERSTISNYLLRDTMENNHDTVTTARMVSLLLKIITIPSKSMNVLNKLDGLSEEEPGNENTGAAFLFSLAHNLDDNQSEVHIAGLSRLKQFTLQILKYQISIGRERNSINYLTDFYRCITQEVNREFKPYSACASAVLVTASLDFYSRHQNEFPEILNGPLESLAGLRQHHLVRLRNHLDIYQTGILSELRTRKTLSIVLECMVSSVDLIRTSSRPSEVSSQLSRITSELVDLRASGMLEVSAETESSAGHLLMCLTRLAFLLEKHGSDLPCQLLSARQLLKHLQSLRGKRQISKSFEDAMSKLKPEARVQLLKTFTSMEEDGHLDTDGLLLLQRVIWTHKDPTQQAEQATAALSQVFDALCFGLSQRTVFRICILKMQCMQMLLQNQPHTISQWNVDNTLTAVAVVSSRLRSDTRGKHTGMIYLGSCRLIGTLLAVHRKKLGGRYHLVVPALQGLLKPLFIPYATRTPLIESYPTGEVFLGRAHAAAYARLLTTLCSPTVSAVARSRTKNTRQELNDETKKARSIAGQHLPYLIMDYCIGQLKGRLLPEVKTALIPGFHGVLDVVQPEVMRTMNSAMDSSSRSIFKALYEEYRRLGSGRRS